MFSCSLRLGALIGTALQQTADRTIRVVAVNEPSRGNLALYDQAYINFAFAYQSLKPSFHQCVVV